MQQQCPSWNSPGSTADKAAECKVVSVNRGQTKTADVTEKNVCVLS